MAQRQTLRYGARNAGVLELQRMLNRAGANIAEDGKFGAETQAAVMRFQRLAGARADGIAGPGTWDRLDAANTPKPKGKPDRAADRFGVLSELMEPITKPLPAGVLNEKAAPAGMLAEQSGIDMMGRPARMMTPVERPLTRNFTPPGGFLEQGATPEQRNLEFALRKKALADPQFAGSGGEMQNPVSTDPRFRRAFSMAGPDAGPTPDAIMQAGQRRMNPAPVPDAAAFSMAGQMGQGGAPPTETMMKASAPPQRGNPLMDKFFALQRSLGAEPGLFGMKPDMAPAEEQAPMGFPMTPQMMGLPPMETPTGFQGGVDYREIMRMLEEMRAAGGMPMS